MRPPTHEELCPAGWTLTYYGPVGADGKAQQRRYLIDRDRVPSVTTLTGMLEKEGLHFFIEEQTANGTIGLAEAGHNIKHMNPKMVVAQMRDLKLDWRSDDSADRGTATHAEVIDFIHKDKTPEIKKYPEDWQPYIQAGISWYLDTKPTVLDAERMVGSKKHRFAGRFDLLVELADGSVARVDLKTSSSKKRQKNGKPYPPYDEYCLQLAGYEIAAVESGYAASDLHQIVRLYPDGTYDVTETFAEAEDFTILAKMYHRHKAMAKRQREGGKK